MKISRIWLAVSLQLFASTAVYALDTHDSQDAKLNKLRADPKVGESEEVTSSVEKKLVAQEKKIVHQLAFDVLDSAGCVGFKDKAWDAIYKYIKTIGFYTPKLSGQEFFNAFRESLVINTFGNPPKAKLPALNKKLTKILKDMAPLFNGNDLDNSDPSFFNSVVLDKDKKQQKLYARGEKLVSTLQSPPTEYPVIKNMNNIISRLQDVLGKKDGFKVVCNGGGRHSNAIVLDKKSGGTVKLHQYLAMNDDDRPALKPKAKAEHMNNPTETIITEDESVNIAQSGFQGKIDSHHQTTDNPFLPFRYYQENEPYPDPAITGNHNLSSRPKTDQPKYRSPYHAPNLDKLSGDMNYNDRVDYYLSLQNGDQSVRSKQHSSGWYKEYSNLIEALLHTRDKAMLSDKLFSKFEDVCSGVTERLTDPRDRIDFIVEFMHSLKNREGQYPVTETRDCNGKCWSEGLFQLSVTDAKDKGCSEINAANDRSIGLDGATLKVRDKNRERAMDEYLGNPDKTILNPYVNISCAMRILKRELSKSSLVRSNNYWGPLNTQFSSERAQFRAEIRKNIPECRASSKTSRS